VGHRLHINYIAARAHSRANRIYKCFVSKYRDSRLNAYITYVRPLYEYALQAWSPHLFTDINKLEETLYKALKRNGGYMDYPSWLKPLAIDSLQTRRVLADHIFTYKVVFGLNDMNSSEFFYTE